MHTDFFFIKSQVMYPGTAEVKVVKNKPWHHSSRRYCSSALSAQQRCLTEANRAL